MRWSQGVWSEQRLLEAINDTNHYFAIPYGPSGTAPTEDARAVELYFERLEKAGLGGLKRPDLLIFRKTDEPEVRRILDRAGGNRELPFTDENELRPLVIKALLAIEAENSLWKSKKMPDYNAQLAPQKRLRGKLGLKKLAVTPTIILKEEDRKPLRDWQKRHGINIHIWQVFYDQAFGIPLTEAEKLIRRGDIEPNAQVFQAPGGATTKKTIYKIYHQFSYLVGNSIEEPILTPAFIEDRNGHILPYVRFDGGKLQLSQQVLAILGE